MDMDVNTIILRNPGFTEKRKTDERWETVDKLYNTAGAWLRLGYSDLALEALARASKLSFSLLSEHDKRVVMG